MSETRPGRPWREKLDRMPAISCSCSSLFVPKNPRTLFSLPFSSSSSFSPVQLRNSRFRSLRISSLTGDTPTGPDEPSEERVRISDEWGEETEPEPESSFSKLSDSDPPKEEDEWGEEYAGLGNGSAGSGQIREEEAVEEKLLGLKRCLVDTVYGTELGFRGGPDVRAEVLELVNQLEAANPTPAPVEASELLDGNWVLLYTAFSELLPLLATGAIPLIKVEKITQEIDSKKLTIVNSTTLSSPFASFSFSASATFEVRTPSRIQVVFKEGILQPPEIKTSLEIPDNMDIFGQKINLSPVQQTLNLVQGPVSNISRAISGQPPLKVPIPGERSSSWLLVTYLDEDLRISRGDGGLFILAKQGSRLLDQY